MADSDMDDNALDLDEELLRPPTLFDDDEFEGDDSDEDSDDEGMCMEMPTATGASPDTPTSISDSSVSMDEPSVGETSVDETSADDTSADETSADESSIEEASIDTRPARIPSMVAFQTAPRSSLVSVLETHHTSAAKRMDLSARSDLYSANGITDLCSLLEFAEKHMRSIGGDTVATEESSQRLSAGSMMAVRSTLEESKPMAVASSSEASAGGRRHMFKPDKELGDSEFCNYALLVRFSGEGSLVDGYYLCIGLKNAHYMFQHVRQHRTAIYKARNGAWTICNDGRVLYSNSLKSDTQAGAECLGLRESRRYPPPLRCWAPVGDARNPPPGLMFIELTAEPLAVWSAQQRQHLEERQTKQQLLAKFEVQLPVQLLDYTFVGAIGFALRVDDATKHMEVIRVKDGGQAQSLGVSLGDELLKINEEDVSSAPTLAMTTLRDCVKSAEMFAVTFVRKKWDKLIAMVARAGLSAVNGKYTFSHIDDTGAPYFNKVKHSRERRQEVDGQWHLLRLHFDEKTGETMWALQRGGADFYVGLSKTSTPPTHGWNAVNAGKDPAPGLTFFSKDTRLMRDYYEEQRAEERELKHDLLIPGRKRKRDSRKPPPVADLRAPLSLPISETTSAGKRYGDADLTAPTSPLSTSFGSIAATGDLSFLEGVDRMGFSPRGAPKKSPRGEVAEGKEKYMSPLALALSKKYSTESALTLESDHGFFTGAMSGGAHFRSYSTDPMMDSTARAASPRIGRGVGGGGRRNWLFGGKKKKKKKVGRSKRRKLTVTSIATGSVLEVTEDVAKELGSYQAKVGALEEKLAHERQLSVSVSSMQKQRETEHLKKWESEKKSLESKSKKLQSQLSDATKFFRTQLKEANQCYYNLWIERWQLNVDIDHFKSEAVMHKSKWQSARKQVFARDFEMDEMQEEMDALKSQLEAVSQKKGALQSAMDAMLGTVSAVDGASAVCKAVSVAKSSALTAAELMTAVNEVITAVATELATSGKVRAATVTVLVEVIRMQQKLVTSSASLESKKGAEEMEELRMEAAELRGGLKAKEMDIVQLKVENDKWQSAHDSIWEAFNALQSEMAAKVAEFEDAKGFYQRKLATLTETLQNLEIDLFEFEKRTDFLERVFKEKTGSVAPEWKQRRTRKSVRLSSGRHSRLGSLTAEEFWNAPRKSTVASMIIIPDAMHATLLCDEDEGAYDAFGAITESEEESEESDLKSQPSTSESESEPNPLVQSTAPRYKLQISSVDVDVNADSSSSHSSAEEPTADNPFAHD